MTSTRMRSMRSWGFSACANWRSRSLSPLPAPSLAFHLGVSLHFRPLSTASLSLNRRGGGTAGGGGLLPPPADLAPLLLLCLSLRIEDAAAQAETKALWMHTMAREQIIDVVYSEDSDLIIHGVDHVIFGLNNLWSGWCYSATQDALAQFERIDEDNPLLQTVRQF